jgi:hypothetical protein
MKQTTQKIFIPQIIFSAFLFSKNGQTSHAKKTPTSTTTVKVDASIVFNRKNKTTRRKLKMANDPEFRKKLNEQAKLVIHL